jgi:hypothetical protein
MVERAGSGARFSEDGGTTWSDIPAGTLVSMNFWGLNEGFFAESERDLPLFLDKNLRHNPIECEYLLPREIDDLIKSGRADVKILRSSDAWFGVTYRDDWQKAVKEISRKHRRNIYPTPLWG